MPASIRDVKAQHQGRLLALPGVVSVGLGRSPEGEAEIVVCLDRRRPRTMARLPQTLAGYPVRVEVIGQVKTQ
ncbi:MAG: hypothetical protein A2V59_01995 [Armatimonadetes bacterium RBG_19FT_COMBO_69_19]|nr:MAG: hypothetical protein A2V59_01995 [Armatimonadetes bacterium RBG_19FT_COMBO_69_19]